MRNAARRVRRRRQASRRQVSRRPLQSLQFPAARALAVSRATVELLRFAVYATIRLRAAHFASACCCMLENKQFVTVVSVLLYLRTSSLSLTCKLLSSPEGRHYLSAQPLTKRTLASSPFIPSHRDIRWIVCHRGEGEGYSGYSRCKRVKGVAFNTPHLLLAYIVNNQNYACRPRLSV